MRCLAAVASIVGVLLGWRSSARADSLKQLAGELEAGFHGRVLSLRVPQEGDKLRFRTDGQTVSKPSSCPWTICGVITADKVRLSKDRLRMSGQRVVMVYSPQKKLVPYVVSEPVEVEIELAVPPARQQDLLTAIAQVFEKDVVESRFTSYWTSRYDITQGVPHLDKTAAATPIGALAPNRPVYVTTPGVVEAPAVLKTKVMRGVFSTQAFKNRLKGFETITFVVNESGFPEVLAVTKSLDRALDVYAIDDIAHLRFRPAHKGAEPVAVLLSLHLEAGGEYRDDFPLAPDKSPVIP